MTYWYYCQLNWYLKFCQRCVTALYLLPRAARVGKVARNASSVA
jgi:hypothetical protein